MRRLLLVILLILSCLARASELTISVEGKVALSSLVAQVQLIGINNDYNKAEKKMKTTLTFNVLKRFKGESEKKIQVITYPKTYNHNGIFVGCTAGFSQPRTKDLETKYIAYLNKIEGPHKLSKGYYSLTSGSNQYLEKISIEGDKVTDAGQTGKMVSMEEKIRQIKKND